jgi:AAA-like domain
MQFKKEFNSSGPNIPERHYTLSRPDLMEKGRELVYNNRYFTLFAPRQSGKSTFFKMLGEQLKTEGYKVCYTNFEYFYNESLQSFLQNISRKMREFWAIDIDATDFESIAKSIEECKSEKLVLVVDEVEGINKEYLNAFLHTIRALYHTRDSHALKSVILVGVKNITGVMQGAVSPFNINEELEVPYFTKAEMLELLEMHEIESARLGKPQVFSEKVKERIVYMTGGQPGLVNGFAGSLVQLFPDVSVFEFEHYAEIEHNYTHVKINKNVSNIVEKAKAHRKFVERLLFDEKPRAYMIQEERIKELTVNGVIGMDKQKNIIFPVPLYRKCLHAAFAAPMNGESEEIRENLIVSAYFLPDNQLNIDKIIRDYQVYAKRRGFRYFMEKDEKGKMVGLREAALVYSFETYIQSFLQVLKGKSYLEPHVALGRSDLIVNIKGTEFVIETKIFYDSTQFEDGKIQLAYYIKSLNLTTGIYLVFAKTTTTNPVVQEADEWIEGVNITTYIVRYDVETDFSAPKKPRKNV